MATTKPAYTKLCLAAVAEGSRTREEIAEFIAEKYGKCSLRCLSKAINRNLEAGALVQVTTAGSTHIDLSASKKRALRRKQRRSDPNRRLKPLTGYNMYVKEKISERPDDDDQRITDFMRSIASSWTAMRDDAKQVYRDRAIEVNRTR